MGSLLLALQYFPLVLKTIVEVENQLGGQPGATKKDIVLTVITTAAKALGVIDETHIKAISVLIDAAVAAMNKAGIFSKLT